MNHFLRALWLFMFWISLSTAQENQSGYRAGYGLVYSVHPLKTSEIDARFDDLKAGGHTSFFFLEWPLNETFSLSVSPGASNLEDGQSQLHTQFNFITLHGKSGRKFFAEAGSGVGGCITTLTKSKEETSTVNEGVFLRTTNFLYQLDLGFGYRMQNGSEIILLAREVGYLDSTLFRLNALNIGFIFSILL